jgi:hypothetical protein
VALEGPAIAIAFPITLPFASNKIGRSAVVVAAAIVKVDRIPPVAAATGDTLSVAFELRAFALERAAIAVDFGLSLLPRIHSLALSAPKLLRLSWHIGACRNPFRRAAGPLHRLPALRLASRLGSGWRSTAAAALHRLAAACHRSALAGITADGLCSSSALGAALPASIVSPIAAAAPALGQYVCASQGGERQCGKCHGN